DETAIFYREYGDLAILAGDKAAALHAYQTALQHSGSTPSAALLNNVAFLLMAQSLDLNEAQKLGTQAVNQDPANAGFLDTLGCIYFKQGDYKRAIETLNAAAATVSADKAGAVYEHIGDTYFRDHQPDKALEWWRKAVVASPDNQN